MQTCLHVIMKIISVISQKGGAGKTTFTVDLGFGVVVVREVPATVCSQCGADWIDDAIAEKLEKIVEDARQKHNLVEVTTLAR